MLYLNQFYTMFVVYTQMFEEKKTQMKETLNEIIVMLTIYHFFCFTNFVSDPSIRAGFLSYSMLLMTCLNMTVNLLPVVHEMYRDYKLKAKVVYKKRKMK